MYVGLPSPSHVDDEGVVDLRQDAALGLYVVDLRSTTGGGGRGGGPEISYTPNPSPLRACLSRMISDFFMILSANHALDGLCCTTRTRPNVPVPTVVYLRRRRGVWGGSDGGAAQVGGSAGSVDTGGDGLSSSLLTWRCRGS